MTRVGGAERLFERAERLAGLAAFLPIFERAGFTFGAWRDKAGVMPWYEFGPDAHRFVEEAYRLGWVLPGFDWSAWVRGAEGQRLVNDPEALARADAVALARLLTAHIRQERFCEGNLAGAFESGYLTAILRRARALLDAIMEDTP